MGIADSSLGSVCILGRISVSLSWVGRAQEVSELREYCIGSERENEKKSEGPGPDGGLGLSIGELP